MLSTVGYDVAGDSELEQHLRRIADLPPPPEDDGSEDVPDGAMQEDVNGTTPAPDDNGAVTPPAGAKPTKTVVSQTFTHDTEMAKLAALERVLKSRHRPAQRYAALTRLRDQLKGKARG
jgi:hypothetical protein